MRSSVWTNPDAWTPALSAGGIATKSGVAVSETNALRCTAVLACTRVIAESIASLPVHLYRVRADGGRQKMLGDRLDEIVHVSPNPEIAAFGFFETLQAHLCNWGNAYAEIERDRAGRVIGLWPLLPDRTMPFRDTDGRLKYRVRTEDGKEIIIPRTNVLHVPGLGFDGLKGYSVISLARQAIGLSLAAEEFGSRFFGDGTNLGGIVSHPAKLGDKAFANMKQSINDVYSGLGRSHRVLILEEGMKWDKIGIPPEDAQFLETRKFQLEEICRIYRVPPHMVADLERATFSNIEHQSLNFVVHTLRPWVVRWEQILNISLLNERDRGRYFFKFNVDGLLRGDLKSRYESYAIGRNWGWLSVNDIRRLEDMDPIDNGEAYLQPLNMTNLGNTQEVSDGE
jgi:HK97 family phage portal protein